jgi:four helix bundle protein
MELAERIFAVTADRAFAGRGDLASQLQRAALSVPNNVAEGFERGTTAELITFLYYARGSAGEVRSMLLLLRRMRRFDHLKSQIPGRIRVPPVPRMGRLAPELPDPRPALPPRPGPRRGRPAPTRRGLRPPPFFCAYHHRPSAGPPHG